MMSEEAISALQRELIECRRGCTAKLSDVAAIAADIKTEAIAIKTDAAALKVEWTRFQRFLDGNGGVPLPIRVDRMERWIAGQRRITWVMIGVLGGMIVKAIWEVLGL